MKKLFMLISLLVLTNCSSYNPMYDPKSSINGGKFFYDDLNDCETLIKRLEGWFEADIRYKRIDKCMEHRDIQFSNLPIFLEPYWAPGLIFNITGITKSFFIT